LASSEPISRNFLDDASIDAAVDHGRPLELPPQDKIVYFAFVDASAGRHDAFTICICHREGERIIADVIRGSKSRDPASVSAEYMALAKQYGCHTVNRRQFRSGLGIWFLHCAGF